MPPKISTAATQTARLQQLAAASGELVIALDFDGTLSPIVADPTQAWIHPDVAPQLRRLAPWCAAIAIVTGRPAQQVIELGQLEPLGAEVIRAGAQLLVWGQYGNQRWDAATGQLHSPPPPTELTQLHSELPQLLEQANAADTWIEDKGLALGLHTRRLADPAAAYERVRAQVEPVATELGLIVEPGKLVVEVRAPGMDKGQAVDQLLAQIPATRVLFMGDDRGDVAAFAALERHRANGAEVVLGAVASDEEQALTGIADVIVDGVPGVVELLGQLANQLAQPS